MKKSIVSVSSALMLSVLCGQAYAQNTPNPPPTVEQLQKQLQQMQEEFRKQQELQKQQIQLLEQQLQQIKQSQATLTQEQQAIKQQAQVAGTPASEDKTGGQVTDAPWRITDPIRLRKGAAFMDIGLVGTVAVGGSTANDLEDLQIGGHDPNQRGFTLQGLEVNFSGAVDPYFKGNANVLFGIDGGGETFVELEEGWLESTSLPGNFQIRAGQYLTEFGRINTQHPHSWAFVDAPLVNARFLGAEGLRNLGTRLSWLAPTPWYTELFLGIQNSHGGTASGFRSDGGHSHGGEEEAEGIPFTFRHADNNRGVKHFDDLLITPRLATSFNLTDNQTLLLGLSGAFGPNANGGGGEDTRTRIYGADLTWKWKPANHSGGFPFVQFQAEAMMRKYGVGSFDWDEDGDGLLADEEGDGFDTGQLFDPATGLPAVLPAETLTDYGFYTQLSYGFRKGWVAGLRFDYVTGDVASYQTMGLLEPDGSGGFNSVFDKDRATRYRISPNLTWYPTEFSKIRLQYNYDDRTDVGIDHSVWLQFEFVLGAHAAHKF